MYQLHKPGGQSRHFQRLPSGSGVVQRFYPGSHFTGTFTGTAFLKLLQLAVFQQLKIGAGGGTRTHTTFYGPRILSPVRLPFRHTGNLMLAI